MTLAAKDRPAWVFPSINNAWVISSFFFEQGLGSISKSQNNLDTFSYIILPLFHFSCRSKFMHKD